MYASNKKRGTNVMLQSLMVSEVMVTTFIWGHIEMGVSKGNIYTESLSLVHVCSLTSPTLWKRNAFRYRWLSL